MAVALIVVLLVASGEADEPSTRSAVATTRDALDEKAVVIVRETSAQPDARVSDANASRMGDELHAGVVVVLTWLEAERRTMVIHSLSSSERREWIDRTLVFAEADPPLERGKTIGFEIASMVPRSWLQTPEKRDQQQLHVQPPPKDETAHDGVAKEPHPLIGVDGVFNGAVGDNASGLGGELAFRATPWGGILSGGRIGAGVRFGSVADASATSFLFRVAVGPLLRFVRPSVAQHQPFGLGLRLDALALFQHLVRDDGGGSSGSRVVPGASGMVEGMWAPALIHPISVVLGAGIEVAFGGTKVLVDNRTSATIEPTRGVGEVGLRWEL